MGELLLSLDGQAIELGPLFVLRHAPFGLDPAGAAQPVERRIEAAVLHLKEIFGSCADGLADAVPVLRTPLKRTKDQQVECALQYIELVGRHVVEILPPMVADCLLPRQPNGAIGILAHVDSQVTQLVRRLQTGDEAARNELVELLYPELRRIARIRLSAERPDHTLQPTALVHEAYLRLFADSEQEFAGRAHVLAVASQVMRRILVDHARTRNAERRGGNHPHVPLSDNSAAPADSYSNIVELDRALEALARERPPLAQAVEMHYFGGMTAEEIAQALDRSVHAVRHDLRVAKAWLRRQLAAGEPG